MHPIIAYVGALLFASSLSGAASAQGVYVTPGEHGPVFSDKPQSGAKEVTLKPLNVVPSTPPVSARKGGASGGEKESAATGAAHGKGGAVVADVYRHFAIVSPTDNGSVLGDTALLEVRLAVDPPLLLGEGHAFVVRINGRFVEQRFSSTEFVIPPEFWDEGYLPGNSRVQVEASIVDGAGQIVMRAVPVEFYSRQRVVYPQPYPVVPVYPAPLPPRHHPVQPPYRPNRPDRGSEEPPASSGRKMK